ncbi:lipopolysaccharide biosynthesis protein [Hoeflea sp. CAU 1731]
MARNPNNPADAPEQSLLQTMIARLLRLAGGKGDGGEAQRMAMIAFAIRVFSAGLAFLSQIILARIMGQFEYGVYVFVWVFVLILGNLACFGYQTALIRFIPQYNAENRIAELRGIIATAQLFAAGSAGLIGVAGMVCLYLLGDRVDHYYVAPLFLGAFALPLITLGDILDGAARANNWPVNALSPTFIIRPILILLFVAIAVLVGFSASAVTAITAALAAAAATTVGQFLVLGRRLRNRFGKGEKKVHFGHWLRVALPIFLVEGFYYLLTNSDVIMVGLFLEPERVATYYAAAKCMALVHFAYFAVKAGTGPRFAELVAVKDRPALAAFASNAARWTFWPSLAIGLAVLATGPWLLALFGPDFADGYPVMVVLLAGILAKAAIGPAEALLIMAGRERICAAVYAVAFTINVGANLVLIPILGIVGAAAATAFAMIAETVLLFFIVRKELNIIMLLRIGVARHKLKNGQEHNGANTPQ